MYDTQSDSHGIDGLAELLEPQHGCLQCKVQLARRRPLRLPRDSGPSRRFGERIARCEAPSLALGIHESRLGTRARPCASQLVALVCQSGVVTLCGFVPFTSVVDGAHDQGHDDLIPMHDFSMVTANTIKGPRGRHTP